MDSMRSLNRSLPSSQPNRSGPPDQLLQAFRQAALSVTNLYKSAAADQEANRQAGYQDALDDLLKFLDRENIGVQDGEGWRIRAWIIARYDGGVSHQRSDYEDDTSPPPEVRQRSTSPIQETRQAEQRSTSEPVDNNRRAQEVHDHSDSMGKPPVFSFRAGDGSTENAMQTDEPKSYQDSESTSSPVTTPIRVEVQKRNNRMTQRSNHNRSGYKPSHRTTYSNGSMKRKLPFPDISEIFNVCMDKKDIGEGTAGGGGSSKRSRLI